jgi:Cft2 family RNA processing exonuclease
MDEVIFKISFFYPPHAIGPGAGIIIKPYNAGHLLGGAYWGISRVRLHKTGA